MNNADPNLVSSGKSESCKFKKSATLTNKALGFSKNYANTVKAGHDIEIAKHVKSNNAKMGMDTADQDVKMQDAKIRLSNAEK